MRRTIGVCLMLLLFVTVLTSVNGSEAFENPTYTEEYAAEQEQLLNSIETLFPRNLLVKTFDGTNKPVISKPADGYYMYSREIFGKRERCLAAITTAPQSKGWGEHFFNTTGSFTNFYFSVEGQVIERDDSKKGYLWIQYTDGEIAGEEGRSAVTIYFPIKIDEYETVNGERIYTDLYDLSAYADDYDVHRFELLRMDGYTRVYIDRKFVTVFEDGFSGRFYHLFGAGLEEGGRYATVQFDNLNIRMQSY